MNVCSYIHMNDNGNFFFVKWPPDDVELCCTNIRLPYDQRRDFGSLGFGLNVGVKANGTPAFAGVGSA